ncbi:unnamed protein product [uncultured bacterium]|nr:unnamed protein product [uncultured bacterium]
MIAFPEIDATLEREIEAVTPLLKLERLSRLYQSGDTTIRALDEISLTILPGEFVAVMGQSGSGKSTLMNIVGCLDQPTSGSYQVLGREASRLSADELATLRRETFGFIFQRYNLLNTASAEENVEIPAIYAGTRKSERLRRASELLRRLGLGDRTDHRPSQLSGGQQQRVAIARALMNNPPLILADEPTGALDSHSGEEVLNLLKALHAEGKTIVLITHDEHVARHAERIVQIHDGKIVRDEKLDPNRPLAQQVRRNPPATSTRSPSLLPSIAEAVSMAFRSLRVNLFRTALTLLGIIIGVAAVVTMLAIGNGSKQKVLEQINAMGTNLLLIHPGAPGVRTTGDNASLTLDDAEVLRSISNVNAVVPQRDGRLTARQGNTDYQTTVNAVAPGFMIARNWQIDAGLNFTLRDVQSYAPVALLGQTVIRNLFPEGIDPVGQFLLIKNVPFQVIGTLKPKGAAPWGQDQDDAIFVPVTTGLIRLFGRDWLSSITVQVEDVSQIAETQASIVDILTRRHKVENFQVRSTTSILETASATQDTFTILLAAVAAISLIVGGIGVMNIMLVSVTERTREIGIRMATGARQWDILVQFNIESTVVCALGGLIGVGLGIGAGLAVEQFGMSVVFSPLPPILAFTCAFLTGLIFGFLPAQKAAKLDPVVALASE